MGKGLGGVAVFALVAGNDLAPSKRNITPVLRETNMKDNDDIETQVDLEESFIKTYVELTGVTVSGARAVFMYAGCKEYIGDENAWDSRTGGSFQSLAH